MNRTAKGSQRAIIIVKALLASYVISAIMLLIIAFFMYKFDPSSAVVSVGIILTYIVSAFVGGFIIGKNAVQKRFVWGIVIGLIYFLIILIVSSILSKDVFGDIGSTLSVLLTCGLGGMLGGMLS
ncbi:predicted membrane protein [Lachnospiraceae bacterium KM106-2]|nr:predicted membrane protein [Lachnospiraceae bacterium KM106-2]